ncbi:MAG: GyrI-like domain-containing protein [Deferribacteraceae bacterium]|jgi:hypothetical protein|nr:GyrI-like domain-containing protein [Deferribacteraceae bacterium]
MNMKHEWKKHEKGLYLPKSEVTLLTVPKQKFIAIAGKGNPNEKDFSERVGVLYSLAYAVRMMPKSGYTPAGYFEYTVYPLEGVWGGDASDKSQFVYTIMIRQPDFVTDEIFTKAVDIVKKKKPHPFLSETLLCEIEDGLSVQMLHIGDYDDEPLSFAKMQEYIDNNGFIRSSSKHREIYLSDANKCDRDKLKTVLRYSIKKTI